MNPIYAAWLRHKDAQVRYAFLRQLYANYDGMLEAAIEDIKKEQKRQRNENSSNLLFGIGAVIRGLWKRFL
jgi:hypothetical protein